MIKYPATRIYTIVGIGSTCSYKSILTKLLEETKNENYFTRPVISSRRETRVVPPQLIMGIKSEKSVKEQFESEAGVSVMVDKKLKSVDYGSFGVVGIIDGYYSDGDKMYILEIKTRKGENRDISISEKIQLMSYCHLTGIDSVTYVQRNCDGVLDIKKYDNYVIEYSKLWDEVLIRLNVVTEFINLAKFDKEFRNKIYIDGQFNRDEIAKWIYWV